jgi:16S rRNA (guanine(966)-N(2))-methyltransferase RsmD
MRITGGRWRSRALEAPRGVATRPSSDRVREALFSMLVSDGVLGQEAEGAEAGVRVLDLYAGTGALAFEALSRGASQAVLVEHGRDAIGAIRKNARALGAEGDVVLFETKVERALLKIVGSFGVVFLDPPYAEVRLPAFSGILEKAGAALAPGGVLVLEHASADEAPAIVGLALDRSRRYGDTTLSLYGRSSAP